VVQKGLIVGDAGQVGTLWAAAPAERGRSEAGYLGGEGVVGWVRGAREIEGRDHGLRHCVDDLEMVGEEEG
jgi:hypothetical protein